MCSACTHAESMKMIQIRNVPDDLHHRLKARAALAGMSLSDYLLAELRRLGARPTLQEWLDRVAQREPVELDVSSAELIRAHRDA